jgi:hypothetical protein
MPQIRYDPDSSDYKITGTELEGLRVESLQAQKFPLSYHF